MAPKRNPLKLNKLQLKTLTLLQELARLPDMATPNAATGEVTVELTGACTSCPASDQTLKAGIERIMKGRVPGVTAVLNVGDTLEDPGTAVSL